jgi:EamA domain-containing membrane protein RarD
MEIKKLGPVGLSWMVTTILLVIGTSYNVVTQGELGIVGIVLSASMAVYFLARLAWGRDR